MFSLGLFRLLFIRESFLASADIPAQAFLCVLLMLTVPA